MQHRKVTLNYRKNDRVIQVVDWLYSFQVTLVKNLEVYGVDVKEFAQSLQHAAASSTTSNNFSIVGSFAPFYGHT